jgi:hypothetical protein
MQKIISLVSEESAAAIFKADHEDGGSNISTVAPLKTVAAGCSEIFVSMYQLPQRQNPQDKTPLPRSL